MKIDIVKATDFASKSAYLVGEEIKRLQKILDRNVNMVLATGHTMIEFLDELSKIKDIDWKKINFFHLDEYKGLTPDTPYSFGYFLNKHLFSKIDVPEENIHYVLAIGIEYYMDTVRGKGGADITMLGIGMDGHLAFNEPPKYSRFDSTMREVELTESTIEANECDYPQIRENPFAYTMGMADIMASRKIFFLANKARKAEIIKKAFKEPITEDIPASILQKHPNVEVILDEEAGSLL